jgi:hypothetical protein
MPTPKSRRSRNLSSATRKRARQQRARESRSTTPPLARAGDQVRQLVASLTERDWEALDEASRAEAEGDAEAALRLLEGTPYSASRHVGTLRELVRLGDEVPEWVVCRWIEQQAHRWLIQSADPRVEEAMFTAVERVYVDIDPDRPMGLEMVDFTRAVVAWDWVSAQLALHDLGGLGSYVEGVAGSGLMLRAPSVEHWARAPMGGYALRDVVDDTLQVTDLANGEIFELLNLGVTWSLDAGTCVIGRIVPSGTSPGLMFASRPLVVDGQTARLVACAAADGGGWLGPLTAAAAAGVLPPGATMQQTLSLVCDVPGGPPRGVGPGAEARTAEAGVSLCETVLDEVAAEPAVAAHLAPCLMGALLDPDVLVLLRRSRDGAARRGAWRLLGAALPQPFRRRCLELALLSGDSSAASVSG